MNYWNYPYKLQPPHGKKYELLQKIGEGANGKVYTARAEDNSIVAIKYLGRTDSRSRERFQNEIKIYLEMQACPYIVKILDYSLAPIAPYIVMEFCKFGNARAQQSWFINNPRDGIGLLLGIAEAVRQLHDLGTYHRDIKPDNLLMDQAGFGNYTLKLGDAGMSCLLFDRHSFVNATYTLQGTPTYIAPELFQGHDFSSAADVFSLGITIHELLTGIRPYAGREVTCGPVEIRTLIEQMVDTDPNKRPTIYETIARMTAAYHQISATRNVYEFAGGVLKAGLVLGCIVVGVSALDYFIEGK